MISKRDAENIFDRLDDGAGWDFWETDGAYNYWVDEAGDWLLQVSHTRHSIVLTHNPSDDSKQTAVIADYATVEDGLKLILAATKSPPAAHSKLRDIPQTKVVSADITVE